MSKNFLAYAKDGKFEGTYCIYFRQADIDILQQILDEAKELQKKADPEQEASVTVYVNRSKRTGKPYLEAKDATARKPDHEDGGTFRREELGLPAKTDSGTPKTPPNDSEPEAFEDQFGQDEVPF
jgi:hypothetical protein